MLARHTSTVSNGKRIALVANVKWSSTCPVRNLQLYRVVRTANMHTPATRFNDYKKTVKNALHWELSLTGQAISDQLSILLLLLVFWLFPGATELSNRYLDPNYLA